MMASGHAKSGVVTGLAVADLAHTSILVGLVLAVLTAGAALLPDVDHPSATAAHAFGPVSELLARGLNRLGEIVHEATRTRYDRRPRDGHRTVTHTLVFAVGMGIAVGTLDATGGRWALLGTLFVLASLAIRGLAARPYVEGAPRVRRTRFHANAVSVSGYAAILTAAAYFTVPQINPVLVGGCTALGCWTHCLGDSCTLAGCPWLWPFRVRGRRWYPIGTPQFLRFRTGTAEWDGEDRLGVAMSIAIVLLAVTLVPHSWAILGHSAHGVYTALVR
jgi:membrane-bound metal-dependent hydrolase YbcI (DUF457 family)